MRTMFRSANTLCLVILTALICSCSKSPDSTAASSPPADNTKEEVTAPKADKRLPPGVTLDTTTYRIRANAVSAPKNGKVKHHLVLDSMQTDSQQAIEQVSAAFADADYKSSAPKQLKQERIRKTFSKPGVTTASVIFYPDAGDKPSSPDVKGRVTITWSVPSEN